ncbi:cyclic nucleotide-binding domain-containing protein [Candidatus Chloroploca sp. Khr17]|uniref:cyclic nucleotide-binding domain-containing protein n=1 Tax=Candidatus Chloroploca sp. Khr17 TaxID=2496869 RepID=UPI00101D58E0|nr:cyclic nucleotide-binding domain-containing protein [Candidatus Chloroploca sp. Khr17]
MTYNRDTWFYVVDEIMMRIIFARRQPRPPGGIWATLAQRVASHQPPEQPFARLSKTLGAGPAPSPPAPIWRLLEQRTNLAQAVPRRAEAVVEEVVTEEGQTYLVLRSPSGSYLRLSAAEGELWHAMDGTQSVTALATMGFLRFRQLLPVAGLVASLREGGFLAEPCVGVYRNLSEQQRSRGLGGWGRRLTSMLRSHEVDIGGIDQLAGALYRWGGWFCFTKPFLVLLALIVIAGLTAFGLVASATVRSYQLIDSGNLGLSLLAFWVALLFSFVLHELAHAVAVKHFDRHVLRGGVMIYYGMPAAFVDTSDIWLAGRRARIIVSLAGPLCDLLVGSLAAIAAAMLAQGFAGEAAYRLAVASYLAALCNLNPLLELDGYYMLSDWLRLPNLRRRALTFIRGPLWQKLRTRAPLTSDERIFALYGLLAAAYTTIAVLLTFFFWNNQLLSLLGNLWNQGGLPGRVATVLISVVAVVPLILGLLIAAWGLVTAAAAWVNQRGYGRNPMIVALAFSGLAGALALLTLRYDVHVETGLLTPMLWSLAVAAQLALHADYRGATITHALDAFLIVSLIELVAQLGLFFAPTQVLFWTALQHIGFLLLLFAGFVALLDIDLHQTPTSELALSAVLLIVAFLAGGLAIQGIQEAQPARSFVQLVILAAPIYTSIVAMALLLPLLTALRDSRLLWSWGLLWVGIGMQAWAYLLELRAAGQLQASDRAVLVLAAGLWAAAWWSHVATLRQSGVRLASWPLMSAPSERERLQAAFHHTYAGLYQQLRSYGGMRRARTLDNRMDVLAATANWGMTLERDTVRIGMELAGSPLDTQGIQYAEALRYTVTEIERLTGATFARQAIRAAYDALPWTEREVANRRCFPNTPWARELSRTFGDARAARLRLLRQVDRFAACDDRELERLASLLEPHQVTAGTVIWTPGAKRTGLWIIEAGEILVKEGAQVIEELHRSEYFGHQEDNPIAPGWHYQASINSELLYLHPTALADLASSTGPRVTDGDIAALVMRTLERAPFFHDLPRETLRSLAREARHLSLAPRSIVIRQGQPGGQIYVIIKGEIAILRRDPPTAENAAGAPPNRPRLIVRLGPDEIFGELEMLRSSPPVASALAITPVELVAIPHQAVTALLTIGGSATYHLEQIGSGRMQALGPSA